MYGGADILFPTPETTPAHPRSNYALQKHTGLEYCRLFSELYDLDTVSLIYFNVFGPNQSISENASYNTVVTAFIDAALNDKKCIIHGDGSQSRDLSYVDNVVQANVLAAEYEGKLNGEIFNIACGETHSINEVFDKIEKLHGKELSKVNYARRIGDPDMSFADISKAKKILNYEPIVYFDEGLEKTYMWYKNDKLNK